MRWIIANDAVTNTQRETSNRPKRLKQNRTHGRARSPVLVGAAVAVMLTPYLASMRMLNGTSWPGVSNFAPLPKVRTSLFANGTTAALATRADSAASQS